MIEAPGRRSALQGGANDVECALFVFAQPRQIVPWGGIDGAEPLQRIDDLFPEGCVAHRVRISCRMSIQLTANDCWSCSLTPVICASNAARAVWLPPERIPAMIV